MNYSSLNFIHSRVVILNLSINANHSCTYIKSTGNYTDNYLQYTGWKDHEMYRLFSNNLHPKLTIQSKTIRLQSYRNQPASTCPHYQQSVSEKCVKQTVRPLIKPKRTFAHESPQQEMTSESNRSKHVINDQEDVSVKQMYIRMSWSCCSVVQETLKIQICLVVQHLPQKMSYVTQISILEAFRSLLHAGWTNPSLENGTLLEYDSHVMQLRSFCLAFNDNSSLQTQKHTLGSPANNKGKGRLTMVKFMTLRIQIVSAKLIRIRIISSRTKK